MRCKPYHTLLKGSYYEDEADLTLPLTSLTPDYSKTASIVTIVTRVQYFSDEMRFSPVSDERDSTAVSKQWKGTGQILRCLFAYILKTLSRFKVYIHVLHEECSDYLFINQWKMSL